MNADTIQISLWSSSQRGGLILGVENGRHDFHYSIEMPDVQRIHDLSSAVLRGEKQSVAIDLATHAISAE